MTSRCPACGRLERRSSAANAQYWKLLSLMAERSWAGQRYSVDSFHRYFALKHLGADDVRLPNGRVLTIPRSTSELDREQFSAYLSAVEADCAERGVFLPSLDEVTT